jgi:hypothetical protein
MGNKTDGTIKFYVGGAVRGTIEETSMTFNVADVQINSKLSHNGDGNTFLNFGADTLGITTGGTERIAVSNTGLDVTGAMTVTNFDGSADASPEIDLFRNSASPADGDYLGQIKFTGENDASQSTVYAKITGKISDVTDGTEDGLIEYAVKIDGTNTIVQRLTGTALKLINGTGLEVAGNITVDGTVDGRDVAADGTKLDAIEELADVTDTANVVAALTAGTNISIAANGTISSAAAYDDADVDAYINASILTTDISEGTNLYFTDARAIAALTAGTNVAIAANGTISATDTNTEYSVGDGGLTQKNFTTTLNTKLGAIEELADVTDTVNVVAALTAGTNITIASDGTISSAAAYADADVDAYINASILTTDISEGTNLYYTDARADARIGAASIFALTDVASGTVVTNLNADKVDGFHGIGIYNAAGTLLNG